MSRKAVDTRRALMILAISALADALHKAEEMTHEDIRLQCLESGTEEAILILKQK